eukprot:6736083-Prymnesium_polylepis.1
MMGTEANNAAEIASKNMHGAADGKPRGSTMKAMQVAGAAKSHSATTAAPPAASGGHGALITLRGGHRFMERSMNHIIYCEGVSSVRYHLLLLPAVCFRMLPARMRRGREGNEGILMLWPGAECMRNQSRKITSLARGPESREPEVEQSVQSALLGAQLGTEWGVGSVDNAALRVFTSGCVRIRGQRIGAPSARTNGERMWVVAGAWGDRTGWEHGRG